MATKILKPKTRPLIVIVGQTASGKTDLAIKIARKHKGEIICADSRTIYKGMDIGTAKPSDEQRREIRHHLLDLIEPDQAYSASEFKDEAIECLKNIYSRDKLPIVVGGTGLYVDSLIYNFDFGKTPDPEYRSRLERLDIASLQKQVRKLGLKETDINFKNKRHLIRALENGGLVRTRKPLNKNTLLLGVLTNKDKLRLRIRERNEKMIKMGLEKEVRFLAGKYGWEAPGLNSIAYKEWKGYLAGTDNIDMVKENMFKNNWQYARRQKIWFKRDPNIRWFTSVDFLIRQVDQFLIQY